ncbi:MAG: aspartate aminotransferase family protein [Desulfamplus sp.]|nr:aspartate aminotransferase family protein [Desulfamplus sp.]
MSKTDQSMMERREQNIPSSIVSQNPLFIEESQGSLIKDTQGGTFIDFASGIGVNNVGSCHPAVVKAVQMQAEKCIHACFHVMMYESYIELAEKLNALVPISGHVKTMLANSGAEAVENAVKIARCYTKKRAVICFDNAFHGRTMLTMTMTSKIRPNKMHTGAWAPGIFRVHFPYCFRCPWNLAMPSCNMHCGRDYFENYVFKYQVDPEETAAIILEPVQGEGGFIPVPPGYLAQLRELCDKYNIVLIYDEIQSGFGRSGKMFASEHFMPEEGRGESAEPDMPEEGRGESAEPDIMVMAKSLGGGMPISAVTGRARMMDSVPAGGLGGTYGGNPVACAAALAVISLFESEDLLGKARRMGDIISVRLKAMEERFDFIGDVRGLGAMLALELVKDGISPDGKRAGEFVKLCREKGLIILACGTFKNNIRLLPPLTIGTDTLEEGLTIMEEAFSQI